MKPVIETWKVPGPHPYPWRFAVSHDGRRHVFTGIPNYCATKRSAAARAAWRARWLKDGTFHSRYSVATCPEPVIWERNGGSDADR